MGHVEHGGRYDLWILGPDGFTAGGIDLVENEDAELVPAESQPFLPEVTVDYDAAGPCSA